MRERESWTKTERSSRRICYAWGMSELSNSNQTLLLLQLISQYFLLDTSSNQWQVACCLALAWEWDDDSQNVAFITQSHLADMKTSCGHVKAIKIRSAAYWISPLGNIQLRWNLGHICKASLYSEMLCWSLLCTCLFSCHHHHHHHHHRRRRRRRRRRRHHLKMSEASLAFAETMPTYKCDHYPSEKHDHKLGIETDCSIVEPRQCDAILALFHHLQWQVWINCTSCTVEALLQASAKIEHQKTSRCSTHAKLTCLCGKLQVYN